MVSEIMPCFFSFIRSKRKSEDAFRRKRLTFQLINEIMEE